MVYESSSHQPEDLFVGLDNHDQDEASLDRANADEQVFIVEWASSKTFEEVDP
ncbi:MAG: hypothetical protein KC933_20065 [Myxococcales bacterium]|nr:hypothetical protein [Myxococcales bacterium]MCB9651677.1 hypothetical protein [Deltaproteobacteria bacterium]